MRSSCGAKGKVEFHGLRGDQTEISLVEIQPDSKLKYNVYNGKTRLIKEGNGAGHD